jgi:hypothetical protein
MSHKKSQAYEELESLISNKTAPFETEAPT